MKENENKQKHLPVIGVGPLIVIPQLVVTVLAIILSKMGIIYSLQVKELKTPFIIIGIMLILLGAWLWFSSNFKVKIDAYIKENHLVTSGVYSMVRNPIYSAFFLVCIGAFFIETNIILFVLPVVYYAYMTVFLIKTEEKWLSELYGQEYEEYCKNVNRCIPWTPKRKSNFYWYTRHNYAIIMTKKGERYHATYYAY